MYTPQTLTLAPPGSEYSRLFHEAIVVDNQMYVVGGINQANQHERNIVKVQLSQPNFQTIQHQPTTLTIQNGLNVEGFSLACVDGKLYLWGGYLNGENCNVLYVLCQRKWVPQTQTGMVPHPRAFHASAVLSNRYLLIFGGVSKTQVFHDWHMLDLHTKVWHKWEALFDVGLWGSSTLKWNDGRGFLVCSERVAACGKTYHVEYATSFFEVRITNFKNHKLRVEKIIFEDVHPPVRAAPSIALTSTTLFLMGGEHLASKQEKSFCDDLWGLNLETLQWKQIEIPTSMVRYGFKMLVWKEKLLLLGGLRGENQMNKVCEVLIFAEERQTIGNVLDSKVCQFCKNVYIPDHILQADKPKIKTVFHIADPYLPSPTISISFLTKLSHLLANPLQAFGLLLDNALYTNASSLSITYEIQKLEPKYFKNPQKKYLKLVDNRRIMSEDELLNGLWSFKCGGDDVGSASQYGINLKLASLRLGRACLLISKVKDSQLLVVYFSTSMMDCPEGKNPFNCFYYKTSLNFNTSALPLSHNIIHNNIKHILPNADEYLKLQQNQTTKIYILDLYDLQSSYNQQQKRKDIVCGVNSPETQYSLIEYVKKLYLLPYFGRQVRVDGSSVSFLNLIEKFKQDEQQGKIDRLDTHDEQQMFKKIYLYKIINPQYNYPNVHIYHRNRHIMTISTSQKTLCGVLELPDQICVNLFKTQLDSPLESKHLHTYLQQKQASKKRTRSQSIRDSMPNGGKKKKVGLQ